MVLRALRADRRGLAAVEFGLAAPLVIVLTLALLDVGRMAWIKTTLDHGAQEGARFASVRGASSDAPASESDVTAFVTGRAIGIAPDDLLVSVSWDPNNTAGGEVAVETRYLFDFLLGGFLGLGPVDMRGRSVQTVL